MSDETYSSVGTLTFIGTYIYCIAQAVHIARRNSTNPRGMQ